MEVRLVNIKVKMRRLDVRMRRMKRMSEVKLVTGRMRRRLEVRLRRCPVPPRRLWHEHTWRLFGTMIN